MMSSTTPDELAPTRSLLRYLRDCYRADNRGTAVFDVFSESVSHLHVFEGTERLANGELPTIPGPADRLLPAGSVARMYVREKSLIYGTFVLVGETDGEGRLPKNICAPLLMFPAEVQPGATPDDLIAFVTADLERAELNVPLLRSLLQRSDDDTSQLESLLARVPDPPYDEDAVWELARALGEYLPDVDTESMFLQSTVEPESALRRRRTGRLACVPAAMLALVPTADSAGGVLFDLDTLAAATSWAPSVCALLGDHTAVSREQTSASTQTKGLTVAVPAVLSHAQQGAVTSARTHPLTLVVGPPGTGKSYTMAAAALDHLSRGESVLISARTRHALDVVERKIEGLVGAEDFMIRGGRGHQLRDLLRHLKQLLAGSLPQPETPTQLADLLRRLSELDEHVEDLETRLARVADIEPALGPLRDRTEGPGLFSRLGARMSLRLAEWRLSRAGVAWELIDDYERVLERRNAEFARLLRHTVRARMNEARETRWAQLNNYKRALEARASSIQERRFAELDWRVIVKAFPLWLSTFSDAHRVLPMTDELFDLVLIDEATQCDMASCLPVAARGSRLLVTGDPQQLRHVSFLAAARQELLAESHGLDAGLRERFDFRNQSLLDRVGDALTDASQTVFLNEHFRGTPELIAFSNAEFYRGALAVMTERPETTDLTSIAVHVVAGTRAKEGHNAEEADAVLRDVAELVDSERDRPSDAVASIGIVSPFRGQVDYLRSLVAERLPFAEIERHDVLVGTSHSFQGEERDVIFLSFTLDSDTHPAAMRFVEKADVFNVAVTRARRFQHVYLSRPPASLAATGLLRRYIDHATESARRGAAPTASRSRDEALEEVATALGREGRTTWTEYPVAGTPVDVVVEQGGASLGIDLIGIPGPYGVAFDLERYRMFRRAGFAVFPLPWSRWQADRDRCIAEIERRLSTPDEHSGSAPSAT